MPNQSTTLAKKIEKYFDQLWSINRSILGSGFRDSLKILSQLVPFKYLEFKTGQKVFDWTIPQEWHVKQAYIINPHGNKIADFSKNNLHLVGYSIPFTGILTLAQLKKHLHSIPEQPNAIPYITSYYRPNWGFCLAYQEVKSLPQGKYKVVVDTEFKDGKLVIGEALLKGKNKKEILFSSYLCHPSMANNELSGPLILSFLYKELAKKHNHKYTYRFALMPETIGSIAYLSQLGDHFKKKLIAGYQLSCIGDKGPLCYKKSRQANSLADKAALQHMHQIDNNNILDFNPAFGSDERQYCSPGFNLPVGSFSRSIYATYSEYHTSLDNKKLMDFKSMVVTLDFFMDLIDSIENNKIYQNQLPYGEPHLGPRGLYSVKHSSSLEARQKQEIAMWWLLNYADGQHDLFDIAQKSGCHMYDLIVNAQKFSQAKILKELRI